MTEAQRKAQQKYNKNNTKTFTIKLNYNTDADLINLLDNTNNRQGFIKKLLDGYLAEISRREI